MRAFAATKNAGKLRELQAIFAVLGWTVEAFDGYVEPVEGETSYAENAALKARALAAQLRAAGIHDAGVIGDDSGLEVAALGGRPGVLSARYGGSGATWSERRQALLAELRRTGSSDRRARFVCAMHFVGPDGAQAASLESVEGEIAQTERGEGGFSYDAIFLYPPLGKTFAELTPEQKDSVSHRARAASVLLAAINRHRIQT